MVMSMKIGDGIAVAAVGDTLVTLWRDPATPERVRWLTERLSELASATPGDMIHFMLILASSSPPGAEARALFQKQITELDKRQKLRKFIAIALGDSVWINIVRAMGRTMLFVIGKSHLLKLLANVDEGLAVFRVEAKATSPSAQEVARLTVQLADALGVKPAEVPGFLSRG